MDSSQNNLDYTQQIIYLLHLGQTMCGQTSGVIDRLCKEVVRVTGGQAQLYLRQQMVSSDVLSPPPNSSVSFPIQFGSLFYGSLYVTLDLPHTITTPTLSLNTALLLSSVCAWLLYTLEQSAMQMQYQQTSFEVCKHLTKSEYVFLTLMSHQYSQEDIAKTLNITLSTANKHRQNIFNKLGVHCGRDALLVAHQGGLFSPLCDLQK